MTKANPDEFARQVLHSLAALGAEVEINRRLLCDVLAHLGQKPAEEIHLRYVKEAMKQTDESYLESCAEVNLDPK
jgi:hypothetical protein